VIAEGYSRNYESQGKSNVRTVEERFFSEATAKEVEQLQPLPAQKPDLISRAGTSYFSSYLSSLEEYSKIRRGSAGPIKGGLGTGTETGTGTGTTKRLHRSKSEPTLKSLSPATVDDSDGLFKPLSSSKYGECQGSKTPQNSRHGYGAVLSDTLRGFSASSSSSKENCHGSADVATLRRRSVYRLLDSDLRKHSETLNRNDGARNKPEFNYRSNPHRSIIDVADDDSYEAHYDRFSSSRARGTGGPDPGSGIGTGTSSRPGPDSEIGPGTMPSSVHTLSGKRHSQRGRSSDAMLAVMAHQDDNHNHSHSRRGFMSSAQKRAVMAVSREKVRELEDRVLDHVSGHLGTLRHSLLRNDLSRSGEVSFDEFRSAVQHCGVDMTSADLHKIFGDFATTTRGKGTANAHAVRSHDLRIFDDEAINIEHFTEHLARRHEERSSAGGIEHTAERQRAFKKVLRASSKHADPGSVFRQTHCVDPFPHSMGVENRSEGY
jgi:hypothetical protein